jgi:hypothetical protein
MAQFAAKVRGWYRWHYWTTKLDVEAHWLMKRVARSFRGGD